MKTVKEIINKYGKKDLWNHLKQSIIEDVKEWRKELPEGCWLSIENKNGKSRFIFESDYLNNDRIKNLVSDISLFVYKFCLTEKDLK